jgi:hypothetical protein
MRLPAAVFATLIPALLAGQAAPAPTVFPVPSSNAFSCAADSPPTPVTHELRSGLEASIDEFFSVRLDAAGKVQEVLLSHDAIPSLSADVRESLARWEFTAPKKSGAPVAAWATVRADLKIEYSKPQVSRFDFRAVAPGDPLPPPLETVWDESWLGKAPPLADRKGAEPAESLDTPPLPGKTRWRAKSYKGPFSVRLWLEISPSGKITRFVPVELKDPVLLPFLRQTIGRWTFLPAREKGAPVACWGILEISGTTSYDVSLLRAASVQKSIGGP